MSRRALVSARVPSTGPARSHPRPIVAWSAAAAASTANHPQGDPHVLEQLADATVTHGDSLARSLNRKAARQPCFAGPRLAGHQKILALLDLLTGEHIASTTFYSVGSFAQSKTIELFKEVCNSLRRIRHSPLSLNNDTTCRNFIAFEASWCE